MKYIWRNGKFISSDDPGINISSRTHGLHYSTCIIEGTAAYHIKNGKYLIFRLDDHLQRLIKGAELIGLKPNFSLEELREATIKIVQLNAEKGKNIYLRHFIYNSSLELGVGSYGQTIVEILTREFTPYLGPKVAEEGATLWWPAPGFQIQPRRSHPILSRIKWAGNYGGVFFWKKRALEYGFHEVVVEGPNGYISETAGSCLIFVDRDGNFLTPADDTLPLPSITLKTSIHILEKLGHKVKQAHIAYDDLIFDRIRINAAALFGTWTEIVPVGKIKVGDPPTTEITFSADPTLKKVEEFYRKMVRGEKIPIEFPEKWLTLVD